MKTLWKRFWSWFIGYGIDPEKVTEVAVFTGNGWLTIWRKEIEAQ